MPLVTTTMDCGLIPIKLGGHFCKMCGASAMLTSLDKYPLDAGRWITHVHWGLTVCVWGGGVQVAHDDESLV
jgi:hypothetical protein